jgi:urease accessory protein
MCGLVASAALGVAGVRVPFLEHAISLSVVLFGLMLLAANRRMPMGLGLGLIAAASSLHGLAHGAETPDTGFASYAVGFLLTTAALHIGGVGVGLSIRRWLAAKRRGVVLNGLGVAIGAAGIYLFSHLAA